MREAPRRVLGGGLVLAAVLAFLALAPAASHAAVCTPPVVNQIACENSKPGTPQSQWEIEGAGDPTLQGFATSMSVNKGQPISFKIKSATPNYTINIYRLGYYGGDGARLMQGGLTPTGTSTQPPCQEYSSTGLIDCGNWAVTRAWTVPSDAVSGVYMAHLKRNDGGGASHILFVVRDDASTSNILLQTSDATWQAYNTYGGNSLYQCTTSCPPGDPGGYKAAYAVSYNRPFHTAEDDNGRTSLFSGAEYPMIRFMERNGYDMSYTSSVDTHRRGNLLGQHRMFISSGHDEYWSMSMRTNVTAARDAGLNLAFFSGNEVFWKTRWADSALGSTTTQDRTMISYKDTHFTSPQDPVEWTGTWRDPRFTTAAQNTPENALTGQSFVVNSGTSRITVPYAYRQLRMWRNTQATSLSPGGVLNLAPSTLGYEWDEDVDNGYRPAGQFRLSSTTVSGLEMFIDYGTGVEQGGTATHNLVMYRVPGGGRVFGAGTVQWSWGLDSSNWAGNAEDDNMQQATVNLFADMGAQPATRMSTLVAASASTDATAPSSTIASPPSAVADGTQLTLSGTASDSGGGVVSGVEVSTDGGTTWHPATGTTSWTYSWNAHGAPSANIKVRAVDDSGNLQTPGPGVNIGINCPCSIWGTNFNVPAASRDSGDPSGVEVGVKFKSDTFGMVNGLRFYKAAANTGTHIGSLWTADGQRLAQVTFTNETASGWQTATFSTPVEVTPGTTYVASYYAPNGHYSQTSGYLYRSPAPAPNGGGIADGAPLHAIRSTGGTVNGVYNYGAPSTFPQSSYDAGNYWVDVVFSPIAAPGTATNVTATPGGRTSANVSWTAPSSGGAPTSYRITPYVGSTAQAATTVNGSPPSTTTTITGLTSGTAYTFRVQAVNPTGAGPQSAASNSVTPQNPVAPSVPLGVSASPASTSARVAWSAPQADGDSAITGYTITPYIGANAQAPIQVAATPTNKTIQGLDNGTAYTFRVSAQNAVGSSPASSPTPAVTPQATLFDFASPATADSGDPNSVELGMKFKADYTGTITGVRFFKSAANTGTHLGSLWTTTGTRLAQATFTGESASGWQHATFSTPVAVTAGTTYVVSYFAPSGHYAASGGGFSGAAVENPPLRAIPDSTSANGVYAYSGTTTFPDRTYGASNYWVDVMYAIPAPGQVTNVVAAERGQTSADVSWNAPANGGPVSGYRITPYIGSVAQAPTTVSGSPPATTKSVTGLTTGTSYTFTVQALNVNGAGPASAQSNAVTPAAPVVPSKPAGVVVRPADETVHVGWTAPDSDGDSPLTGYTVTPYVGASAQSPVQVGATATSTIVSDLDNGVDYTFRVTARNTVGASAPSNASAVATPRMTIFDFTAPANPDSGDGNAVELGMKFRSDVDGQITGLRFFKSAANTGTHVGTLWTADGTALRQATFTNESASGWQHVAFASPVSVTAGTTYVASYQAPNGHYSAISGGLSNAVDNGPLRALADSTSANGVYRYGASGFPTGSYNAANYFVDVMFQPPGAPGVVTGVSATATAAGAQVSWTAPAGSGAPTSYTVTPYVGSTAQTPVTVTGTPPATTKSVTGLTPGTAYTFTVRAANGSGSGPASSPSAPVTPLGASTPAAPTAVVAKGDARSAVVSWTPPEDTGGGALTGYTVTPYEGSTAQAPLQVGGGATSARVTGLTNGTAYTFRVAAANANGAGPASGASAAATPRDSLLELATPSIVDANEGNALNLGIKFRADVDGSITGIRFYKAAANTGTHVGTLWSATGTALRQATFGNESASGWQTVTFATPVAITAGTTYVASYLAPNGHYSVTSAAFSGGGIDNGQLHALSDAVSSNGVYAYNSASVFPVSSWNATNYWVDVLFAPGI